MVPRFVMFYADGSVIKDDGEDVEVTFKVPKVWFTAPRDGLQFVVKHRNDGKLQVLSGSDYYSVMQNGEPMNTDNLSALMRSAGLCKSGLWIPNEEFEAVREQVRNYRMMCDKQAKK